MWFREHHFNILHILPFPPPPEMGVTFSSPNHELMEWITHRASAGKSCFLRATTDLQAPRLCCDMQAGIKSTLKFSSCESSPPYKILLVVAQIEWHNNLPNQSSPPAHCSPWGRTTWAAEVYPQFIQTKKARLKNFHFLWRNSHLILPNSYRFLLPLGQNSLTEALSLEVPGKMGCFSVLLSDEFMSPPCATSRIPKAPSTSLKKTNKHSLAGSLTLLLP